MIAFRQHTLLQLSQKALLLKKKKKKNEKKILKSASSTVLWTIKAQPYFEITSKMFKLDPLHPPHIRVSGLLAMRTVECR